MPGNGSLCEKGEFIVRQPGKDWDFREGQNMVGFNFGHGGYCTHRQKPELVRRSIKSQITRGETYRHDEEVLYAVT